MDLSIIIINYKTPALTLRCLESIYHSVSNIQFEIIVVDNCSNDDSEKQIHKTFPHVIWINNLTNEGFGRANNLGASKAKGEYLLFLNSDMLVLESTIDNSLAHIRSDASIGGLGCKLLNEDGSHQKSVYYHVGEFKAVLKNNILWDYFIKYPTKQVNAVMGAFMLMPKNIFLKAGGFDPDFFMYAEELDLCRRISGLGYKIEYTEKATAIHKHGGSSDGGTWANRQNYLSNALLYLKARGYLGYFLYHFLMCFSFFINLIFLWKMDKNYRFDFWKAQRYYFSNFVNYLKIPFLYNKSLGNGKRILKAS